MRQPSNFWLTPKTATTFSKSTRAYKSEHTVTEEVTGVDLVELQLDIALGARLPLQQRHIALRGFAVQARIYAEDPSNGFRPAPSHSVDIAWPSGVRLDSAFEGAGSIPPFYDPMIAKVIASGPTRST